MLAVLSQRRPIPEHARTIVAVLREGDAARMVAGIHNHGHVFPVCVVIETIGAKRAASSASSASDRPSRSVSPVARGRGGLALGWEARATRRPGMRMACIMAKKHNTPNMTQSRQMNRW